MTAAKSAVDDSRIIESAARFMRILGPSMSINVAFVPEDDGM